MEETDPERILPNRKNLGESPGAVSPVPMLPVMGMPMSPHLPARPANVDEQHPPGEALYLASEPAEPFGQRLLVPVEVVEPHGFHALSPLVPAERGVLAERLPALEPTTLPRDEQCCACCGNVHDVPEARILPASEPGEVVEAVAGEPLERGLRVRGKLLDGEDDGEDDGDGDERRDGRCGERSPDEDTEDGDTDEDTDEVTESEVPCACCGKVHPGAVRPREKLSPYQPGLERPADAVPATPGTPITPGTPATPAVPATPANAVELPLEPKRLSRSAGPHEALTPGQPVPPGQQPGIPQGTLPAFSTPASAVPQPPTFPVMPASTTNPGGGGSPFNFAGAPGQTGGGPKDGNVGPDPNVRFDEASYNQLIGEVDTVRTTLRSATHFELVYLDEDLLLQPSGQQWGTVVALVKWGTGFGTSVESTANELRKTLKTFHTALEKGKAVFKDTDDLAAYDATRFTSDYPGFGGGLPGA